MWVELKNVGTTNRVYPKIHNTWISISVEINMSARGTILLVMSYFISTRLFETFEKNVYRKFKHYNPMKLLCWKLL